MNEIQEIEIDVTVESEREAFQINDLPALGWTFRKIKEFKQEQRKIEEYANAEIERIENWRNKEFSKHQNSIEFFESKIQSYHFNQMMLDPNLKTISTPYGRSKTTTYKPSPTPVDNKVLLAHIKENGLTNFIKEEVRWGDYKKGLVIQETSEGLAVFDANGEQVPGVIIKPEETKFSLEVSE